MHTVAFSFRMFAQSREDFTLLLFEQAQHEGVRIQLEVLSITRLINLVLILFISKVINIEYLSLKCHLLKIHIYELTKQCELPLQCAFLVESLKQRSMNQSVNPFVPEGDSNALTKKEKKRPQKLPSPKPTALSLARMV